MPYLHSFQNSKQPNYISSTLTCTCHSEIIRNKGVTLWETAGEAHLITYYSVIRAMLLTAHTQSGSYLSMQTHARVHMHTHTIRTNFTVFIWVDLVPAGFVNSIPDGKRREKPSGYVNLNKYFVKIQCWLYYYSLHMTPGIISKQFTFNENIYF